MKLTESEIEALLESPEALQALIDHHDVQSTMADAMDFNCDYHDNRIKELKARKLEMQQRIDNGDL